MGAEALILTTIGSAALGAVTSASQARAQGRALQASADSSARAAAIQRSQVSEQAEQLLLESRRERDRLQGTSRVLAADAGLSFGTTQRDIEFSIAESAAEDQANIMRNLDNENLRIQSGLDARLEELEASGTNTGLRTISGLIEGGATGLRLGQSVRSLRS